MEKDILKVLMNKIKQKTTKDYPPKKQMEQIKKEI